MKTRAALTEEATRRRVFPSWSITIPDSFEDTFAEPGGYWHARGHDRSVSLSSMVITERDRPVPKKAIMRRLPPVDGEPVTDVPAGLLGWAVVVEALGDAVASRMLSGMLVVDGCVLIVTITSDDHDWARKTWLSIRHDGD